ncbi:MAG: GntR family transcriptional regulator [Rhizobiaceae bacterium]
MFDSTTRRTSADDVFDYLYGQINTLTLLPGTRISEIEISRQFDVSRQPVREAFIRLANRGLLLVRPQKATVVRRFSTEKILRARFIRTAVECEVLRQACRRPLGKHKAKLERALLAQEKAIKEQDIDRFHALDYDFHRALCAAAGSEFVFETIVDNKAQVDRLCILSLSQPATMDELIADHRKIVDGLIVQDEAKVLEVITYHLSRLDGTVSSIRKSHADYFED